MSIFLLDGEDSDSVIANLARDFAAKHKTSLTMLNSSTFEKLNDSSLVFVGDRSYLQKDQDEKLQDMIRNGSILSVERPGDIDLIDYRIAIPRYDDATEYILELKIDGTGIFKEPEKKLTLNSINEEVTSFSKHDKILVKKTTISRSPSLSQLGDTFIFELPEYLLEVDIVGENIRPSHVKATCKLRITLSNTPEKSIVINTHGVEMQSLSMEKNATNTANNSDKTKGFFNDSALIQLIPGGGDDPKTAKLKHLHVKARAPESGNFETKYTSTTGWRVALHGSVNAGPAGPGGTAGSSLTYSKNNVVEEVIKDFSVRGINSSSWYFYYTLLEDYRWASHFTKNAFFYNVDEIAVLGKGIFPLRAECVYQLDDSSAAKDNEIEWTVHFRPKFRLLHSYRSKKRCYSLIVDLKGKFKVNMEKLEVELPH